MKKTNKIIAGLMAVCTLGAVPAVSVSATTEDGVMSPELQEFIKNSTPIEVINERCKMFCIYTTTDENGNKNYYPGIPYSGGYVHAAEAKLLGYDEFGKVISGDGCAELVWFDENGNPAQFITRESLGTTEEGYPVYKTSDVVTGEDMLVIDDDHNNIIAKYGDTNLDGNIDIRDVAALKQDIVKLNSLPDYAFTADINSDGVVDVKDLGMLNNYIIKVIDKF
jgi:hypothetical protein